MCPERERERERERKREREMEWDNVSRGREGGRAGGREGGREREMEWDIAVGALDAAHEQASTEVRLHQGHIPCVYPSPLSTCMYPPPEVRLGSVKGTSRAH